MFNHLLNKRLELTTPEKMLSKILSLNKLPIYFSTHTEQQKLFLCTARHY